MNVKLTLGLCAGLIFALWWGEPFRRSAPMKVTAPAAGVDFHSSHQAGVHLQAASEERTDVIRSKPERLLEDRPAARPENGETADQLAMRLRDWAAGADSVERSEMFGKLAEQMSADHCAVMLGVLMRCEMDDPLSEFRSLLVRRWAELEPAAAAASIANWPDSATTRESISQVAIVWAQTDLHHAVTWVQSLPEGETKSEAQANLGYEAARSDVSMALALAAQLSEGSKRENLLSHTLRQWVAVEPSEAIKWVSQMQDSAVRERLLADITMEWAAENPAMAAGLAVDSLSPGDDLNRCVTGIVQRWAQQAPEAAANWIAEFPLSPLRDTAVQNLLMQWTGKNLEMPAQWITQLPGGPFRDSAVDSYAIAIAPQAPDVAREWIGTIEDNSRRVRSGETLSLLWPER